MAGGENVTWIDQVFHAARRLASDDRKAFLTEACCDDEERLREVESLLTAAEKMDENFLEEPFLPLDDDFKELAEGHSLGAYRVLREIDRGGMGKVYLAARDDDVYQQEVAVKVLKRGLDTEDIVRRFRYERRILARLDHPYIVRILDGGTTVDGLPYFVMEYVEGEPIDRYCDRHKLSVRERLELFRKVCTAVRFAHRNLVIHCDLKPRNILVKHSGEPKLLDFGIAKFLEPGETPLTRAGVQPMTSGYASPEQLVGDPMTPASDSYSLGRILSELLTGSNPFGDVPSRHSLFRRVLEQEPELPSRTAGCGHLAGDLDSIVLKAQEKDPRRRYASVEQFSEDVGRYLEGLPVRARQGTAIYRLGKFVRRHLLGVAMVSAVIVGILGVSVGFKVLRDQAVRERERAELLQQRSVGERKEAEEMNLYLLTDDSSAVSSSGIYSSSYNAWKAFDGSNSSMWISETGETPAWIAYDWGSNRVVHRYKITNANGALTSRAPKDFQLQGWNGSNWVTVDTRSGQTGWLSSAARTYEVASPGSYSKYRLYITDDNDFRSGVVVISIEDLRFEHCSGDYATNLVPNLIGDSSAVSTSGISSSRYEAWKAFDSTSSMWISQVWETPAWIAYAWNSKTLITQYTITNTNGSLTSRAPKDFQLQGRNGSGSWVTVDTRSEQTGWVSDVPRSYTVTTPGSFREYRLYITDDNDNRSGVAVISIGDLDFNGCRSQ